MTEPLTITVLGEPVGKAARAARAGISYLPQRTENAMATVNLAAKEAMRGRALFDGALKLTVLAEFAIPGSWSKKRQAEAPGRWVTKKPDASNVLKLLEDAMKGVVWHDDKQIAWVGGVRKVYGSQPKVVITVEEI